MNELKAVFELKERLSAAVSAAPPQVALSALATASVELATALGLGMSTYLRLLRDSWDDAVRATGESGAPWTDDDLHDRLVECMYQCVDRKTPFAVCYVKSGQVVSMTNYFCSGEPSPSVEMSRKFVETMGPDVRICNKGLDRTSGSLSPREESH